jgi:enolase
MPTFRIKSIKAREILDSRGNPTIEADLITDYGLFRSSVPSGASKGEYEALELRDGGKRYLGRGVLRAVQNINEIISPKLVGKDPTRQREIDNLMIELDGTENKSNLGANAIIGVSMAICRAGAAARKIPLYQYITQLAENCSLPILPVACFNIINGGVHAGNELDLQEFMICPQLKSFSENLQAASEIYHNLKEILLEKFGKFAINIGDEGGFSPPLIFAEQTLNLILEAIEKSGYKNSVKIAIDSAASEFFIDGKYKMKKVIFTREGLLNYYFELLKKYPIISLEDPFAQDDFEGFSEITKKVAGKITIFGDDLLATNIERIKMAKEKNLCDGIILKMNQIGTITETLDAAKLAKSFGWKIMVSHRSSETNDDFISDLAVGISADFIKAGAPARGERVTKYNRLLKIEEEIKD